MTEQLLIDINFDSRMAEMDLLTANSAKVKFVQDVLQLGSRKLNKKTKEVPRVLAARMGEPYETPLHPGKNWTQIVELIGRYASWYCHQQQPQNQNETAPTTREQRIVQLTVTKNKIENEIEELEEQTHQIKLGKLWSILQVQVMNMPDTEETYLLVYTDPNAGFINPNRPAPPKVVWDRIIDLRREFRLMWNDLDVGKISGGGAGRAKTYADGLYGRSWKYLGEEKEWEGHEEWREYFTTTLETQVHAMHRRIVAYFCSPDGKSEPFDEIAAYIRTEITSIVLRLCCDCVLVC